MKKHGFTLAEVLVTLGIIGVVSALVMPTFTASVQTRKIGPKLAKAVAAFEQAAQAALEGVDADSFTNAAGVGNSISNLWVLVGNNLKGFQNGSTYTAPDGTTYTINGSNLLTASGSNPPHRTPRTSATSTENAFMIDINGSAGPNVVAQDRFYFTLEDDGSLVPWGSRRNSTSNVWTSTCPNNGTVTQANAVYCAAHVMENGLKVTYKASALNGASSGQGNGVHNGGTPADS